MLESFKLLNPMYLHPALMSNRRRSVLAPLPAIVTWLARPSPRNSSLLLSVSRSKNVEIPPVTMQG